MRNVIITGGSRGIGLAIASTLAAAGYRAITVARAESDALRAAMAAAKLLGHGALCFRSFDLCNTAAIPKFAGDMRREFGTLYGLINNAGMGTSGVLAIMPDAEIERLMRLNVTSPILLTKYVIRSMMVSKVGRVVNVSSVVGSAGYSGLSVYAASKAALLGFTRSLAREVGQLGITVNAVAPGFVETDMTRELDEEQRSRIIRRSALRRLVSSVDIASAVEFLLSDSARSITGTTLTVDAGSTA